MNENEIHDVIGIGIGPFNLGLAALLDEVGDMKALFLEKKTEFNWHPGMLIDGTTLQVPFFADLVSMADVRSKYTFLNYLQAHNRLYHFYFLEKFHIPRKEYNHYCRWVSDQLPQCRFGMEVERVVPAVLDDGGNGYEVSVWNDAARTEERFVTRHLVMGIGSVPSVPEHFREHLGSSVFHTSEYLEKKEICKEARSVTVIGSGQSAAEVFLDVAKEQENHGFTLDWFTRSKGFFPMEYSKLGLEYFSPDYTDFFYSLPQEKKDALLKDQDLLYKGISADTIAEIYDYLYERSIGSEYPRISLQAMTEITGLEASGRGYSLRGYHQVKEETFTQESDVVIFGTGYKTAVPSFLSGMKDDLVYDVAGRFKFTKDYRLETFIGEGGSIFVQNGEMHTHGVGAPDLGLGAHRNAVIINQLAGREVYPVQTKNVFQTFGVEKRAAAAVPSM
ncbi:lysine N(6)-hydroxylase/L-ornithine N(5)-oxygenase family protein [Rossellomorea aquimaris]|uniref:L-lysine N6-monooxygenase MbtG n=1 Tax=Rossellomorea aquimaris TaxID=189382 RepID=A0A1J6VNZ4_9BACI|nr:lysine N(6)-hydroxylase/L-ornithine N(5)-oxygenase family protein [Rossellomorea aquimaris]OIU66994.1 lysine 6-monooxygenase [Rossellomorea aquimaris]